MVAIVSGNSLGVSLSSLVTLGQSAVGGTATQGRNGEAAYVNAATGNLVLQDTDLMQPERGNQQIASVRTYNSLGSLGPDNWTKGFDLQKLSLTAGTVNTAGSIVTRTDSDGAQAAYAYNATTGLYVSTDGGGAFDTISYDAVAHVYTRTDGATQARESYTSAGVLVSMTDSDGNVVTVTRNTAGQVASVIDPNGETRTYYDYDASHRLSQIRTIWTGGAQSTVVRYTYDASNRLSTVTVDLSPTDNSIADNNTYTTTYTYVDTTSHIASITQKDGTSLAFTYDTSFRVATITDQAGNQTTFAYDTVNANTTVTDPNKNNTVYHYDASGRLASVTAPTTGTSTATTSYTYDANGNVAQIVDGAGRTVTMSYDANGNQTLQQDGAGNTVTRTFDALDHMVTETAYVVPDPDGAGAGTASVPMTTRYVYDPAGQHLLRFVLTPEGRVTEYRYDASGNRTSTIQYGAAVYALSGMAATDVPTLAQMTAWTPTLDLTRTTRTDVAYDAWGQPMARTVWTQVDASGAGVADNTQSVTHFTYGQFGQLLNTISPLTGSTTYTYDGLGRVLTALNAAGLTTTSYDDANNKTQVTYANGLIVTSAYDKAGRLLSVTQGTSTTPSLGVTQYAYDADGNLRMTTQPDGVRHYMLYDAGGRKVADIDGNGSLVESVYDNAGKLVETIQYTSAMSAAQLATLVDASGNPTNVALSTLRPTGLTETAWTLYDAAGRVSKQVDAMGFVTETRYDGASRVTDVIRYANSTATVMTTATVASGVAVVANATYDRHTRTFYDNDGNAVAALDAAGYLTESVYDAGGNLVHTIAYATVSPSAYWATGTLAQLRPAADPAHDIHAWNYYDAQGRLAGSVDGEGYLTEFGYDVDGHRVRTLRYAAKALIAPTSITSSTTLAQLRPTAGAFDHTTTAVYNALDQLTSTTDEHGTVTQYTYDSMGHVLTTVSAAATSDVRTATRMYDVQGRLVGELGGRGSAALAALGATPTDSQIANVWATYGTSYSYDAGGLRTSMTDAAGNKTLYFYDADGHQTFVVDALGEVTETRYNALNLVSATIRYVKTISVAGLTGGPDSQVSTLVAAVHSGTADYSVSYAYDARNEINRQVDALSYVTTKAHDAFGEVYSTTEGLLGGATETSTATYDRRGLVTATLADTVANTGIAAATAIVRDAFGRATSVTDADGNVTTTTYDRLGRAVQATDGMTVGKATTYTTYDAFGRTLTSKDGNGYTTTFTWNDASLTLTMSGPASTSVVTTYDRHGETVSVRNENGVATTTQYDLDGHVVHTIVDSDSGGLALDTRTDYDTAGRVADTVDANGVKTVYAYDAANRVYTRTVDSGGLTLVTRFTYDGMNNVLTQTDPDGIVTKMTYDAKGEVLTRIVDPTGTGTGLNLTTTFTYDSRGNTVTSKDPAGTVTTYTYDHLGRRITMTVDSAVGGLKLLTSYAYDKAGNLMRVTDPRSAVTRYLYDADGRVHFTLDNEGGLTETDYDADGRVTKHVVYATRQSPMMTVASSNGTVTNTMTAAPVTSASDQVTQTTYDANGRKTLVQVDPNGLNLRTQYAYDNAGNLTRVIDPDGNVTRTQYDKANRAIYVLDPANTLTQNSYDKNGRVLNTTTYATPPTGISTVVAANGSVTNTFSGITTSGNDKTVQRTYDNAGRQLTSSEALGSSLLTTRYEYDANGNVTRMTDPAGNVTRYVYDNAGRLRFKLDALSRLTETDYDLAGRIVASIAYGDAQAGITTTQAANGLVTNAIVSITPDAALDRVTRYAYDSAGRLVYTVDPVGNVTENQYDASGNLAVQRHYVTPMDLPTAGSTDGKTVTVAGNTAEVTGAAYVAIDPTHTYTVTVRARQLSGTGQFYAGVITKDAGGNVLSNSVAPGGTYAYCAAPGVTLTPEMGWQTFSGSITGTYTPAANTTNTGKQFFAGSTSAAPLVLYNYGSSANGDPGREVEIDSVTLYDNTTGTTINVDPALVNGKSSLAMVSGSFDTAASSPYATLTLAQVKSRLRTSAGDQITRYAYDYDNRQLYQVDANGVTTKTAYDAAGNVVARTTFGTPIDLPTAGSTDGKTVTVAGNTAEVTGASYAAIDPTHSYTLTVRARQLSGTGQFYAGVITKDASGSILTNVSGNGGTYSYCAANTVTLTPDMGWQTFSGNITGSYTPSATTAVNYNAFIAGSVTAAPLVLYNYGATSGSDPGREVEIDSVTLYDNTTGTTVNVDPALLGGNAALAMVSGSFDAAPSAVDAQLTAAQISARLRVNPAIDRTTRYAYDAAGRAVLTVDPTGQVTETTYDNDGNAVAARAYATCITVPTDYSVALSAAAIRGALSANTASDRITRTVYDADARVIYTVGAQGLVTSYVYDDFGNVSSQTTYATPIDTSTLGTTLVAADVTSRLTVMPAQDRTTRNVRDALGRVVLSVDPVGQATLTAYDADSRVTSVRQLAKAAPIGSAGGTDSQLLATVNASIDDTRDRTTRAFYDADGRQVYAVDGRGYITETRYFTNHTQTIRYANAPALGASPTTASVAALLASSGGATQTTDQYYDADGNATDHVDAAGVTSRNVYDGLGRLVTHIDALGKLEQTTTGYTYDAVGRVLTKTTAQGTAAAATTVNTYDAFGRLLTQVSPQGYDLANVDSAWAQATRAKLGYPSAAASLTPAQKSALLALYTTSHAYDLDGRETTTTNAAGATTTTTYDAFGDAIMVVDPLGNAGYFYFDALGRVTLQVDPVGIATRTVYTAGFTDKVASVRRYALTVAAGSYSATTPPALTTNAKDAVTSYTYDADGRVLTTTDGAGTESIVYQASANGVMDLFDKVVTNKVSGAATYLYDQSGNETSETLPVTSGGIAVSNTYVYDGFGNRTQSIEGVNLATSTALPEARTTQYRYDAMGRVIYRIGTAYTAADSTTVTPVDSTTYDALGRVIETRTNASWNSAAGTASGGVRTLNYFDAAGNQVMTIAADGAVVAQTFTPSGKVYKRTAYATALAPATFNALVAGGTPPAATSDAANDRVTTARYDSLDRLVETDLDGVVHWEQSTDPGAPVILTLAGSQPGTVATSKTIYDANGNVVQQIDGRGNSTYNYYDAAGRKTLSIDAGGFATAWDYNSVGGSATANAFDTPIRQVQYSTALAATAYARQGDTSVADANLRTPGALRATLDAIVAAAGNPNRITTYTLDNAGRVTQKTILGVAYSTVAQGSGSAFTTSSGTAGSVTTTTYDGLGDILTQQQGAGDTTTYVYDALGRLIERRDASFTGIVDTSGTAGAVTPVTDTEYDALGNVHRTIQRGTNGGSEADDRITLSTYDANGNLTQQTDANGNVTKFAYDALGRVARSTVLGVLDASGGHTDEAKTYTYDALGRQISQTDVGTGQITFTKYDAFGEIVNKGMGSVATGTTPVYQEYTQYNVMGKVQRSNTGDGVSKIYLYDLNGNTTRQITSATIDLTGVSIIAAATDTTLQHTFSVYDTRNNLIRTVEPDISYQQDQVSSQAAYSEQLTNLYGAISVGNSTGGSYTAGSVDANGYGYTQVGGESGSSGMPGASKPGVLNVSTPTPTPSTSAAATPDVYFFPLTWGGSGKFSAGLTLPASWTSALTYRIIRTDTNAFVCTPVPGQPVSSLAVSKEGVHMLLQASSTDMGWTTVATLFNSYTPAAGGDPAMAQWGSTVVLPCMVAGLSGMSVDAFTNFGTPSQTTASLTALGGSEYTITNPGSPVTLIGHNASGIPKGAVVNWPGGVLTLSPIPQAQVWTPANQRTPIFSSSVIATSGSTTLYYRVPGSNTNWSSVTLSGNTADLSGVPNYQPYEYILSSNSGLFYGTFTTGGAGQLSLPQTQMSGTTAPPGFAMLSAPMDPNYSPKINFDLTGTLVTPIVAPSGYVMSLNFNGHVVEVPVSGMSATFDPQLFGLNLYRYTHTGDLSYSYNVYAVQDSGARQFVGQGSGTMNLGGSDFIAANGGTQACQPTAFLTLPSSTALTGTLNVGGISIGVNSGDWRVHRTTDSASNPVLAVDLSQFLSQTGVTISYSAGDAIFSGSFDVSSTGLVKCNGVTSQVRQKLVPLSIPGATSLSVLRVGSLTGPLSDVPALHISTSGSTFTWDASDQAGLGSRRFYYEARNGGALVGAGYGTMTLDTTGALTYSMDPPLLKPSTMTFTPPVTTKTFTLSIRPHGSTGAYTATVYDNLTPGQMVTYDATGLRPGSGSAVYDYLYLGTDSSGNKVSGGNGTLTVNADGTTSTTLVSDRAPLVLQGPAGEHVPRMEIDLAPHGSSVTPTKVYLNGTWNATLNCSVFSWDVNGWQPADGSQAAFDYTMTMQNSDGSAFKNEIGNPISITGVMTLGASTSSSVSIQQYVKELDVAAQVKHNQTFDAFGEISAEYDDATLQRAQADVALYGGTLDPSAVRTTFLYNTMGELIQKMDPQTSITLANGFRYRAQPVTTYAYDLDGRLTVTTDANGNKTEQNYAGSGGRVHNQWAGDGGEKTTDYDTFGSVAKLTDELSVVTLQKVDKMGNLVEADHLGISRIANASSGPNMVAATLVDTYTYDAFGHRITHTNASTVVDKTYYDSLGRVIKTVSDAGRATTYAYTFVPFGASSGIAGNGGASIGGYQLKTTNADTSFTLDNINYFGVTTWHQDEGGHGFEYDYDVGGHLAHQFSVSSGQNIYYTYYANGDIKQSADRADHTLTRYGYDNAGNRTWEQYSALNTDNVTPGAIFQSSTISYDELNRMMHVSDPSVDVQYQYDAVGNRRSVQATYFDPLQGLRQQDNFWYTYDAANRFLITKGSLAGHASSAVDTSASIVQGTQGVIITYDQRGQRKSARNADGSQEAYTYTADGYLQDTTINGTLRARRRVDALGRTFEYLEYDTGGVTTTTDQTSVYDADSHLMSQTDVKANSTTNYFYFTDTTNNQTTATQTGAGALAHVDTTPSSGVGSSTIYSYVYWDSAKETGIQVKALGAGTATWASGFSQLKYDANGYLTAADDTTDNRHYAYVNSANGLVLRREETGSAGHFFDYWYYASDRMIGDVSSNAAENAVGRTSYAEQLAQSAAGGKVDPNSYKHTAPATSQVATADFDQNYQPINSTYPAATGSTYTVRNGDTLKSIARQVWGDADMWYLIAQANNLSGSETLVAGQVLQIPNKVTNIHNNANTFRPYNPGEVIGHIDPSLPQPPPPPSANGGGGCGTIGTIIMVVVAVVATIYTCGAAAELLAAAGTAAAGTTGFAATMALGGSVLAGTAGAAVGVGLAGAAVGVAAAAIGGAVGSIAAQAVGDAMGNTKGFSWKQVATAAIGSAITAGVGEAFAPAASAAGAGAGAGAVAAPSAGGLSSLTWSGVAHGMEVAAASTAVQEAVKGEWSWRQIAASAVASGAGQVAGAAMASAASYAGSATATNLAQKFGSSMGGAWASQEVMATDPRYSQARTTTLFDSALNSAVEGVLEDSAVSEISQYDLAQQAQSRQETEQDVAQQNFRQSEIRQEDGQAVADAASAQTAIDARTQSFRAGEISQQNADAMLSPEDAQAAFRQSERDYRASTQTSVAGSGYVAQRGDSISTILGSSNPQDIGNFMRANGLTSSTIQAGQNYFIPDDGNAYGDSAGLGQAALNSDNHRLAALEQQRAAAQSSAASSSPVNLYGDPTLCNSAAACTTQADEYNKMAGVFANAYAWNSEHGNQAAAQEALQYAVLAGNNASVAGARAYNYQVADIRYLPSTSDHTPDVGSDWSYMGQNSTGQTSMLPMDNRTDAQIDSDGKRLTYLIAGAPVTAWALVEGGPVVGLRMALMGGLGGAGVNTGVQLWKNGGDVHNVNWTDVSFAGAAGALTFGKDAPATLGTNVTLAYNNAVIDKANPLVAVPLAAAANFAGPMLGDWTQEQVTSLGVAGVIKDSWEMASLGAYGARPANAVVTPAVTEFFNFGGEKAFPNEAESGSGEGEAATHGRESGSTKAESSTKEKAEH